MLFDICVSMLGTLESPRTYRALRGLLLRHYLETCLPESLVLLLFQELLFMQHDLTFLPQQKMGEHLHVV